MDADNKGVMYALTPLGEAIVEYLRRAQAESAQLNPTNPSPTPHKPSSAQ